MVGDGGCKRTWLVMAGVGEGLLSAMRAMSRGLRDILVTTGM